MNRQFVRYRHSIRDLQSILSNMKVAKHEFPKQISKLGTSDLFHYATDKRYGGDGLQSEALKKWNKLQADQIQATQMRIPLNGFEEAIQMTEEGRLWKYPIDNEYGMDAEKQVPFEEHVFLDVHLKDFPQNEHIQTFMGFVVAGLAKNPWMTSQRKRETIRFYKDYFESKRDIYKQAGFDM